MTSIGHPGQSSPIPPVHSALQNRRTRRHRPGPPRHAAKQIKKTCLSGWHKPGRAGNEDSAVSPKANERRQGWKDGFAAGKEVLTERRDACCWNAVARKTPGAVPVGAARGNARLCRLAQPPSAGRREQGSKTPLINRRGRRLRRNLPGCCPCFRGLRPR